jgi:hypothetical protein
MHKAYRPSTDVYRYQILSRYLYVQMHLCHAVAPCTYHLDNLCGRSHPHRGHLAYLCKRTYIVQSYLANLCHRTLPVHVHLDYLDICTASSVPRKSNADSSGRLLLVLPLKVRTSLTHIYGKICGNRTILLRTYLYYR